MKRSPRQRNAFTLIEIMIVVALLGIVMAFGLPTLFQSFHKQGMRKAVTDIQEILQHARAEAIMHSVDVEVVIIPDAGTMSVQLAQQLPSRDAEGRASATPRSSGGSITPKTIALPENIALREIDINSGRYETAEEARIRFHPDGTSDECILSLFSDLNEKRVIAIDMVTGLADLEFSN